MRSKLPLISVILITWAIVTWQQTFISAASQLDRSFRMTASSGMHDQSQFVYFMYYLRLYPLASTKIEKPFSRIGARDIIQHDGKTLITEINHTTRYGDLGKAFLYLPYALVKGSPQYLNIRFAHQIVFIFALILLFLCFWARSHRLLGILLVAFLGSNPFQLYEVYANQNIFSWPITLIVILLAVHIPLLDDKPKHPLFLWISPILSGIILACAKQIRSEPTVILFSVILCYLFITNMSLRIKWCLVILCLSSYWTVSHICADYFRAKIRQADQIVIAHGGEPYLGPRDSYHMLWHAIWCGLGDFDQTHGYIWKDSAAALAAAPRLKRDFNITLPNLAHFSDSRIPPTKFWDKNQHYYKTPYETPHYNEVLRKQVLADIGKDPLWYLVIIFKRLVAAVSQVPPVRLSLATTWIQFPYHWLITFLLIIYFVWRKCWFYLKLLVFFIPLSIPAVMIYSGGGMTYYGCLNIITWVLIFNLIFEYLKKYLISHHFSK